MLIVLPTRSPELYKEDTVFQIHSKAADHPLPGKGTGEKVGSEGITSYIELASLADWRRKLSHKWVKPFKLHGKTWNSVEHYYQANKFKDEHPELYSEFALDSDSELSKDVNMAKAMGSKTGRYKGEKIRPKNVNIDPTFFDGKNKKILEEALMEKFSQDEELKLTLLNTGEAKIMEYIKGSPPNIMVELMKVRNILKGLMK